MNLKIKNLNIYILIAIMAFGFLWIIFRDLSGIILVLTSIMVLVPIIYEKMNYYNVLIYLLVLGISFLGLLSLAYYARNNFIMDVVIVLILILFSLDAKTKLKSWNVIKVTK